MRTCESEDEGTCGQMSEDVYERTTFNLKYGMNELKPGLYELNV